MTVDKNLENTNQEEQQCKKKNRETLEVLNVASSAYDNTMKEKIREYAKLAGLYYYSYEDYNNEPIDAFKQKWDTFMMLINRPF